MGKTDKPKGPLEPSPEPFQNNPFAKLRGRLGELPGAPPATPPRAAPAPERPGPPRAVVRLQRKGYGGKEVTVVDQLGLGARELDAWLTDLKRQLGCGGHLDGGALVLQGDKRERVKAALEAKGVRKVTVS